MQCQLGGRRSSAGGAAPTRGGILETISKP